MAIIRFPINDNTLPVKTDRDYPVNQKVSWHGGIHLDITPQNVYAIMEGDVCYARDSSKNINTAPLNYRGATNDGCVLLRHSLSLDHYSTNSPTVIFYSLYMHLSMVDPEILKSQGKPVKQDTILGRSGVVDGASGIHFQICCDFTNLKILIGRETNKLNITKNGRTDVSYGDTHYYLPTKTFLSRYVYQSSFSYYSPAYETIEPYYLIVGKKTTKMLLEQNGEYQLVKEFVTTYSSSDLLYIDYFGQVAYLDTKDTFIKKYTDADFPHWLGWSLIDDDKDQNSQCNSSTILSWLNSTTLSDAQINQKKQMAICNFPFEWDASTVSTRFSWLKTDPPNGMKPFSDEDMQKLEDHIKALCFYDKLPAEDQQALSGKVWHFEPRAFIKQLNKINILPSGVFVWTETKGTGHAFLSVHKDNMIYVYSYGRYDGGYGSASSPLGNGVLIRFTNKEAITYIHNELYRVNAKVFQIKDVTEDKVIEIYDRIWRSSNEKPSGDSTPIDIKTYGRVIGTYDISGNNCTTKASDVLKEAGSKIFYNVNYEESFVIPSSLETYLMNRSNSNIVESTDLMKAAFENSTIQELGNAGRLAESSGSSGDGSGSSANSSTMSSGNSPASSGGSYGSSSN